MKLMECVPNFSEGRDQSIIDALANAIKSVNNVVLLDVDPGADTNRTVITMAGEPEAVLEAAFQAIKTATELIDMRNHQGEHPRMGATDVCPFIPISDMTMEECVEYARRLGKRVGDELGIPVYLYEYAATKEEWHNLSNIRAGEYEALPEKAKDPAWKPDFGPHTFNAKSGAIAIGAREFLIAYNINLNTRDKKKASELAAIIRESGRPAKDEKGRILKDEQGNKVIIPGLFQHCKAVGWYIESYKRAQISINLTNYKITPPHIVLEKVRELASERGIVVTGSELVGLIPKTAILNAGKFYLERMGESTGLPERMIMETAIQSMGLAELAPFDLDKKVIEYAIAKKNRLSAMSLESFADLLSTATPAPGGGSVAAYCAALSAALTAMVSNLTINKKGYESVQDKVHQLAPSAQEIKLQALQLTDEDTDAFNAMMEASRLPKKTEEEIALREKKLAEAMKQVIIVPLNTIEVAYQALELADEIARIGNTNALSDAGTAALTALTAVKSAYYNVQINLPQIEDKTFKEEIQNKALNLLKQSETLASQIESFVSKKLTNA